MKVILTGTSGLLVSKYIELYPKTKAVSVRYNNLTQLIKALPNSKVIIHASANLNPITRGTGLQDNVVLTKNILEKIAQRKIHIILISSMSILGRDGELLEPYDMTNYAFSKYLMEELVGVFEDLPITVVRFSTLFYKDPSRDGLSKIIYEAKTKRCFDVSNCKRDFLPLEIACRCLHKLCNNKKYYGKTVTIASGETINMLDIAEYLKYMYDVSYECFIPKKSNVCYDFSSDVLVNLKGISFNIYDLIDEYYDEIPFQGKKKGN